VHNRTLANWRIVCLLASGAFLGLGVAAYATGVLPGDLVMRHRVAGEDTGLARLLAILANEAGTWHVLLPATALLLLLSREARRHWWLWCAILIASSLVEHGAKFLVGRPRPSGSSLGFPSGHTTAAATFAVLLIYLSGREQLARFPRLAIQGLAVLVMVLVAWARVSLHAHWPTDVLGGLLLGAACAAAGAWWECRRLASRPAAART